MSHEGRSFSAYHKALPVVSPQLEPNISSREANNLGSPNPFTSATLPRYSLNTGRKVYFCAHCGKPRSARYHESHPLIPSQTPEPDICSRPRCAPFKSRLLEDSCCPKSLIVEVHHYYHGSPGSEATANPIHAAEVSGESSLPGRVEVLGDVPYGRFSKAYWPRQLYPIRKESPPPINRNTKPTLHL